MQKIHIGKGSKIDTISGYIIVTGYNGSIVDCDEYVINDNGEPKKTDERRLTLFEIGHLMKEVDGLNYRIFWKD